MSQPAQPMESATVAHTEQHGPRATPGDLVSSPTFVLIGRRLAATIPVLLGVSLLTFLVVGWLPGSTAEQLIGMDATPDQVARLEAALGLDRPAWVRYIEWLGGAVTGDLGNSLVSGRPAAQLLAECLPVTLGLVAYAFVLSLGLAVPAALLAARRPDGFVDRCSMGAGMLSLSCASYVLALVLILVFAVTLGWFPSIGYTPPEEGLLANLQSLTLPAFAIALPLFGFYTRFLRTELVDQLQSEGYVVAARAKGLGPWEVLLRHALPNSAFGLLTIVGLNIGTLIGGTVVIEQIFALPGVGAMLLQAVRLRDIVVIQAIVLTLAVITVAANLAVDLLYAAIDPRVRYERR